jgi:hypothetical protein
MSFLPSDAMIEISGPSSLGKGMIEVSWERQRYAVFKLDLETRAIAEPSEEHVANSMPRD